MTDLAPIRCPWAETHRLLMVYHDEEWGVPLHDDRRLFEMLNLEGAQAGLSWLTILKRREQYRAAFDQFHAETVANYDAVKQEELLQNEGIIRNRLKIQAVVENARAFLEVQREFASFDAYIWQFVDGRPIIGAEHQDATARSVLMSKDLKKHGFRFVGATVCYAFMQAVGMVNDHIPECFRAKAVF
jgi:DNA-3-methyladenine glycosylase I